MGVGLFGVDVSELPVEDKVASEGSEGRGDFATQERVREHGTVLCMGRVVSCVARPDRERA